MVVVAAGRVGGVVDTAPAVGPPPLSGAGPRPDPALEDDVGDTQGAGVGPQPLGQGPAAQDVGSAGEVAEPADRVVAGASLGMVAARVPGVGVPASDRSAVDVRGDLG